MTRPKTRRPANGERRHSRSRRPGLTTGQERIFNIATSALVILFTCGWSYAIADARARGVPPPSLDAVTQNPLSPNAAPETPYLLDAAIRQFSDAPSLRGYSGEVRISVQAPGDTAALPDSLPSDVQVRYSAPGASDSAGVAKPTQPGVWNVLVRMGEAVKPVPDFSVLSLVPLSEKRGGRIGTYLIGSWPYETGARPRAASYQPPRGLVRVTPENMNTQISEHFQLRDFLTKGQQNVWPKYVALSPRLLDKLELVIQEIENGG